MAFEREYRGVFAGRIGLDGINCSTGEGHRNDRDKDDGSDADEYPFTSACSAPL